MVHDRRSLIHRRISMWLQCLRAVLARLCSSPRVGPKRNAHLHAGSSLAPTCGCRHCLTEPRLPDTARYMWHFPGGGQTFEGPSRQRSAKPCRSAACSMLCRAPAAALGATGTTFTWQWLPPDFLKCMKRSKASSSLPCASGTQLAASTVHDCALDGPVWPLPSQQPQYLGLQG